MAEHIGRRPDFNDQQVCQTLLRQDVDDPSFYPQCAPIEKLANDSVEVLRQTYESDARQIGLARVASDVGVCGSGCNAYKNACKKYPELVGHLACVALYDKVWSLIDGDVDIETLLDREDEAE